MTPVTPPTTDTEPATPGNPNPVGHLHASDDPGGLRCLICFGSPSNGASVRKGGEQQRCQTITNARSYGGEDMLAQCWFYSQHVGPHWFGGEDYAAERASGGLDVERLIRAFYVTWRKPAESTAEHIRRAAAEYERLTAATPQPGEPRE